MADGNDLVKMVPGFEFLQNLMKNAGAAIPGMNQWVAPTLDPQELDKRIQELKTVQFWLEQNARLIGTTVQALEVQRMTLSTLQTMNLPMADLRDALKIREPAPAPARPAAPEPAPAPAPAAAARKKAAAPAAGDAKPAAPAVDPLQWWGALTQQFTELAAKAMQESPLARTAEPPAAAPAAAAKKAAPKSPAAARKRAG